MTANAPTLDKPSLTSRHHAAPQVTFTRLIAVQARKLIDTRAARWLLVATMAFASAAVGVLIATWPHGSDGPIELASLLGIGTFAMALLLPVVAIVAATGEWTHHIATLTYTVEPRRLRVLFASAIALVAVTVTLFAALAAICVLAVAVCQVAGLAVIWNLTVAQFLGGGAFVVFYALVGLALGTMIMNTPAAIVTFFLIPSLLQIGSSVSAQFAEVATWININHTLAPLIGGTPSALHWGHVLATTAFWILIPLTLGGVRLSRREVA